MSFFVMLIDDNTGTSIRCTITYIILFITQLLCIRLRYMISYRSCLCPMQRPAPKCPNRVNTSLCLLHSILQWSHQQLIVDGFTLYSCRILNLPCAETVELDFPFSKPKRFFAWLSYYTSFIASTHTRPSIAIKIR